MHRFFGMLPIKEVKKEVMFLDRYNSEVIIQAGPNGWSVIYVHGSSSYKDEKLSTEENFQNAYNAADDVVGPLIPITPKGE